MPATEVRVAAVGDAWEGLLAAHDSIRLHASDDYHAGENGQYLNALSNVASFPGLTPNAAGQIAITIQVSPAGTARFGYLGAILLTKTGP